VLQRITPLARYAACSVVLVLITLFYQFETNVGVTTIVLTYLLAILIASSLWGLGPSVFMSVVATLILDYNFFPPIGKFTISDPQDWVSLFAFLVTSVVGSDLHARARRQAEEADRQRKDVELLYQLSSRLLKAEDFLALLNNIPKLLVELLQVRSAALYMIEHEDLFRAGVETLQLNAPRLKTAATNGQIEIDLVQTICVAPVQLGMETIGSFGIVGAKMSADTLKATGTLIASSIDRAHAFELLGKAEAVRESERLKSVFLDAVTHDFKTPLTSIKASATSLLEDLDFNRKQRRELLEIIDEECDRINRLIGETGEMARLEAGEANLQFAPQECGELISTVLSDCADVQNARLIQVELKESKRRVYADLTWARKVFSNIIRNANLYSSPGEPITISAHEKNGFIMFSVSDKGPGMDESEIKQVFDRFYRGKNQRHRVAGTGLGLPISKAIVEAHGGTIEVTSRRGEGSVFTFGLPTDSETNERE
jgi:two-component system sensor histidine kinase KdpD